MAAILDGPGEAGVSHCPRGMAMLKLALRRTLRRHCCAFGYGAYREQETEQVAQQETRLFGLA